ncbi:Ribosomal protein S18 acetylase RimI and related acetyltransferases [Gulbenkiania indica]|uniref:Ribosomal protein S18 acetylase RimI and related acetyltransferases n=1 Tax=Gulbenkiania indica TaxID=375574 RepID=A0A0K6GWN2_9NEIS|nr:GNAT family N-acetyltransferase [Gulbenkiania indica]CUA83132.1 Ribosomal protein S18 acetylase RimI and related acetyltransferases [Gulbenkiania indica]
MITLRPATAFDADALRELILIHGPNPWNWLPPEGVEATLMQLVAGQAGAVLAEAGPQLVGAVIHRREDIYPALRPVEVPAVQAAFIVEAVVHRDHAGQGIGARLLASACAHLADRGCLWVVADRHEENAASAGMMRKAGFAELAVYDDPQRRTSGTGRTTVCGRYL